MNERTLADEFRDAFADEPPLGFDPDEVVTRLIQRRRRRLRVAAAAAGVVAVAAVGVGVPAALSHRALTPAAGPSATSTAHPTSPPATSLVTWQSIPTAAPSEAELQAAEPIVVQRLYADLSEAGLHPKVLDPQPDMAIGPYPELALPVRGVGATATLTAADGMVSSVSVAVLVPERPGTAIRPNQVCGEYRKLHPQASCALTTLPDGTGQVVVDNAGPAGRGVLHLRPNGVLVSASSRVVTAREGHSWTPVVDTAQLVALAADPAFTLR
jgi:hypothetical protein